MLPERYSVREKDGVKNLFCDEAPRVRAVIDPDMAASRSDAVNLGEGVILLDGAGTFGPALDNERKVYNLDHHWSCERLFTLSTCEQALLLVHSGLGLSDGDWTLYANDPDLDTVLALWCLLNHRRVRELKPEARDIMLPLLRLEGAIDSNGRELAALCGLPSQVMAETHERIEALRVPERRLKQEGAWNKKDPYAYTVEMLQAIDALVFRDEDFGDYTRVEEIYGHVEVAPRKVAVVCRDRSGIYTVEQLLKTHWGDQLALVALENQPGQYTLRRVSSLGGPGLEPAYAMLNRMDPAVDGRPPGKRWGGSQDIGGSPRPRGTLLASAELIEALKRAYRRPGPGSRAVRTAAAGLAGLAFAAVTGPLASLLPGWTPHPQPGAVHRRRLGPGRPAGPALRALRHPGPDPFPLVAAGLALAGRRALAVAQPPADPAGPPPTRLASGATRGRRTRDGGQPRRGGADGGRGRGVVSRRRPRRPVHGLPGHAARRALVLLPRRLDLHPVVDLRLGPRLRDRAGRLREPALRHEPARADRGRRGLRAAQRAGSRRPARALAEPAARSRDPGGGRAAVRGDLELADGLSAALWVLAGLLVVIGILGTLLPVLPGSVLVFVGLALAAWIEDFHYVGPWTLGAMAALTLLASAVDPLASALGARRLDAHPRAVFGSAAGALVGVFFGLPGILIGPFAGAVLGELSARRSLERAGQVGLATWLGMLVGGAVKLCITLSMVGLFALQRLL